MVSTTTLPIPASTQPYLRPFQNPELEIHPELHIHRVMLGEMQLGLLAAGPAAVDALDQITGISFSNSLKAGEPTDVILFLTLPPTPGTDKRAAAVLQLSYAGFEQRMDEMGLDSVTTPGFYPYWVEAITGISALQPKGNNLVQRLFKNGRI